MITSNTEEIMRRFRIFANHLNPEQRRSCLLSKNPKQEMCPVGSDVFDSYCDDPWKYRDFIIHIHFQRVDKCMKCYEAFLRHLFLVIR